MPITRLEQMLEAVKSRPRRRLVAAYANDAHTIEAVHDAVERGIVEATLVGDEAVMRQVCADHGFDPARFTFVHEPVDTQAAARAVALVRSAGGQILMKGLVSTDKYMRAILHKEAGLMSPGAILSHVSVIQYPTYPKLIVCGDVAVLPYPDLKEKVAITNYVIGVAQALGIPKPKVALIAASEQVLPKVQATIDAAIIAKMAERGQIKGAFVDGPMALDVAVDGESAATKGIAGSVAGDADCLVFPNIDAGNVFYKTSSKLAGCELAAMVAGAQAPCILSSRGDSVLTKLYSITLAALTAK
ncbi:phosphate acyltransferase [Mesoterricola silvestris]|uniref:Phosphate butyryltransferase n=1 Tax=Mesoterricola silvestris TaxID=2927979 RepID=A0AA48GMC1_9BACT|nr:phosphate acyltransferase [Mesoterricola silvestris]BDU73944.1 phosphate butyryltransferase [Mesoterricola silvestris]